jgi:hypothetical protein
MHYHPFYFSLEFFKNSIREETCSFGIVNDAVTKAGPSDDPQLGVSYSIDNSTATSLDFSRISSSLSPVSSNVS